MNECLKCVVFVMGTHSLPHLLRSRESNLGPKGGVLSENYIESVSKLSLIDQVRHFLLSASHSSGLSIGLFQPVSDLLWGISFPSHRLEHCLWWTKNNNQKLKNILMYSEWFKFSQTKEMRGDFLEDFKDVFMPGVFVVYI